MNNYIRIILTVALIVISYITAYCETGKSDVHKILDEVNEYLNEKLPNVGDIVKQGETISSVGSSGGVGEPGLYFELRYKGKPINPQPWLSQR